MMSLVSVTINVRRKLPQRSGCRQTIGGLPAVAPACAAHVRTCVLVEWLFRVPGGMESADKRSRRLSGSLGDRDGEDRR
jgi:hypothetical protein